MLQIHSTTFLFTARALRDMGDGFVAVLLPAYLLALGFSPLQVGIIATASLLGSAFLTIGAGFLGVRYDHRQLLFAAAGLMVATGAAFAVIHDYALLLLIAFAGTVNPSAGSVSVFVPLEHAVLAREVADAERTRMFARYSLVGALAGAAGALASATPDLLGPVGLDQLNAIKAMFVLYALLGLLGGFLYAQIPVAAWLSQRIGLINTMVFTHIPSSIALMLAAFAPTLPLALVLLLIRAALSQMDVPSRSSYVMAVVTEAERAAAASFTSVPRSLAAAASPALAGALFAASLRAWPLVLCGVLKIIYDLLLLMQFRHLKPPEER